MSPHILIDEALEALEHPCSEPGAQAVVARMITNMLKSNSVSQISDYLRRNMEAANIKSIKRPLFTITLAMGSERVIVDNEDAVPDELTSVKSSITPDKKAIATKLKEIRDHNEAARKRMAAGEDAEHELLEEPKWAHLERGDSSIRIK